MTRSPARILKRVSLCSSLAIATALVVGPTPAAAQSFEANNVAPVTTNGAIVTTSPGATNIALNGGQTVIDWTPNDTAVGNFGGIGFQYGGTATFSSANNFAVLNRINPVDPTRIISMDGNIVSTVGGQTGGSVYFYSPAGIVLGPNALINVGSLVLTTSPIEVTAGQFIGGVDGTTVKFGNANPNSYVFTNPGSTINTLNNGSYVAMVAPRVGHDGTINVNGSAALVAAEAATISFNTDGLFNITVDVGTAESQNEGINVNGTITGPVSSGAGDYHRAYLVAVPKNTLLTMAIGSGADLGFDIAGAADVVGNAVVLSAGHDISFGSTSEAPSAVAGALANLSLTNNNFTSALYGRASGEANVGASGGGTSTFASDVSLRAGNKVAFTSRNPGSTVTVGGNLTLSANANGLNEGDAATAGTVELNVLNGGSLSVAGNTNLTAVGIGGFSANPLVASGNGTGGTILLQSTTGGDLSLGGTLNADASGYGGSFFGAVDGGNGTGGTVNVFTSGGSSMSVTESAILSANGIAGQGSDCFQCGDIGGIGDGGNVTVQAHTGPLNSMTFGNGLTINANGLGGSGQSGGLGDGGDVIVTASGQSTLTVTGDVLISANGDGGNAFGVGGDGGDGFGGNSDASADNGALTITGSFATILNGDGGSSEFGNGGYGQGGFGELFAWNGGTAAIGTYAQIFVNGDGGDGLASGGEGQGGWAYFSASSGGTLTLGSYSSLYADGEGGNAFDGDGLGGNGGLGEGGHVEAYANDATLDVQGTLVLSADGSGGDAGGGRDAGDSLGGDVYLQAVDGGTLSVAGGLYASAVGVGAYIGSTTNSGDGTGGFIGIYARDGDSTLTVGGDARLDADGVANAEGECFPCGGIGGIGQGGIISISSQGVTGVDGNVLTFSDTLTATASGYGGNGIGGAAGDGFGGSVTLNAADGNKTNVVGDVRLEAIGSGGFDDFGLAGGDGTGGLARINTTGTGASLVTLSAAVLVDASAFGGDSELTSGGTGGNGQSGMTRVIANGGGIAITGNLTLRSISSGGSGDNGGDGIAFIGTNPINTATSDARVVAYGGSISVGGSTTLDVSASGGSGANGGSGGDASGGYGTIHARNSNLAPSTITLGTVVVDADATGGSGGAGLSDISGSSGGDGGSATGGFIVVTAAAGNGQVTAGNLALSATATGGAGGDGGTGFDGPGGDGGDGGSAIQGGAIFVGSESGLAEATGSNTGTASFGNVSAFADGIGGNGGFANSGFPGGTGGNGGSGDGGLAVLQTRGALVTVGLVDLTANGTGGDGGGSETGIGGIGGDGIAGEVGVIATSRSISAAQRGTLDAGLIFASATGTGGLGSTDGLNIVEGGSVFQVENADATIDAVTIEVAGDTVLPGSDESRITVINGAVTLTGGFDDAEAFYPGDFSFITPGDMSLFADNGSMTADNILTLTAGNFIPDAANEPPLNAGTYFANLINITSGLNIYTTANLDSMLGLNLNAAGFIVTGNLNGNAGDVFVDAQGGLVDVGNVDGGFVNIEASDSVDAGDITSDSNIQVTSGADMNLGNLVAGVTIDPNSNKAVRLNADGSINVGNVTALGGIDFDATGSVTGLDLISGEVVVATADGAISFGDISSGLINPQPPTGDPFSVGLDSGVSISVGNVAAANGIGFVTFGALTTGDLNAGSDVLALAGGDMLLGAITAGPSGRTYLADVSMWEDAGGIVGSGDSDVDPEVIFAATPVATGGSITTLDVTAGSDIDANAGTSASFGTVISSTGAVQLSSVASLSFLDITAGTFVTIDPTDIVGGDVTALAGDVNMTGGSIDIGNVSASDNVLLTALAGDLSTGTIDAGIDVTLGASGDVTTGNITAGGLIDATGASLTLGNLSANSIDLTTTVADLTVGNVTIPGDLALTTAGDLVFGNVNAFDVDLAATASITGGFVNSATDISAVAGTEIDLGNLNANGNVALDAGDDLSFGDLNAFVVNLTAGGAISGGNIDSDTDITASAGTGITFLDLEAGGFDDSEGFWDGSVDLTAGGNIGTGGILAEGSVTIDAGGSIGTLSIGARDTVDLAAIGSILTGGISASNIVLDGNGVTTGDLFASNNVTIDSAGSILTGAVDAFGDVEMDAVASITTDDIVASTIDLFAGGDITTGDLTTQLLAQFGEGFTALLFPGASITLESGGDIATGAIDSRDGVYANAGGAIATGSIDAVDFVQLLAGADIATGYIFAGGFIDIFSTGGGIATGDLTGTEIDLEADGDISFADVDADSFDFEAGGAVSGGNIVAFSQANGDATGAVTLGNITVGPGLSQPDDFSVGIASETSITVGDVSGTDRVGFATLGDLTTGDLSATDLVMTLVGGDITTGSITTQSNGTVYMADASMFLAAGGPDDFDPSLVLAAEQVSTGGSISIGGPVSTGQFRAAAGGDLNAGQITAQGIHGRAGGTATISGLWSAGSVDLASNDINILATGGISASGSVALFSSNATQALIGDGLTGSGYALSNAEFSRIEGGSVFILARGDASAAQDMLIGDLTVTGPSAGSTIENSEGILVFATGDVDGETPSGVIRVVGDVVATGFGSGNAIEFYADRFELDAATGGISITSSGSALSGELGLYAKQIHVAEGSILDQLAANPQYSGYQDDLNEPAAVQRPEGVLNAATIWIESDNLQNILIQNTGTEETPAGFLAQEIFVNDDEAIAGPPGSIDLVVNGQLQTEGGTLTGIAVRDALVEGENLTPFTDNSTINGCELVGDCGSSDGPIIGLPTEFSLIIGAGLPELPFDGDEASSAIQAPPALFDTRPLDPDGTVDEPISGSGNPALIGSGPTEGDEQCAAAGTEEKRQCAPATNSGDQQ